MTKMTFFSTSLTTFDPMDEDLEERHGYRLTSETASSADRKRQVGQDRALPYPGSAAVDVSKLGLDVKCEIITVRQL